MTLPHTLRYSESAPSHWSQPRNVRPHKRLSMWHRWRSNHSPCSPSHRWWTALPLRCCHCAPRCPNTQRSDTSAHRRGDPFSVAFHGHQVASIVGEPCWQSISGFLQSKPSRLAYHVLELLVAPKGMLFKGKLGYLPPPSPPASCKPKRQLALLVCNGERLSGAVGDGWMVHEAGGTEEIANLHRKGLA